MQAVSCTTIEQDDSWTTYLTDNDRVFFDTIKDCGAEGVFHFCTKFDGFDMRTVRQFSPDKINTELFRLMNMTTGSGNYTYRRKDTNLYMSCSTLYPTSNLRGKDIRSQNRCSQITALVFDIDNHAPDADPDLPQRICDNLEEAMLFDLLPRGFIVNTGRGAAIWMFLKPCNPNNTRVKDVYDRLHQKIREMLKLEISSWGEEFADVTLDESVQGSVHLMRVPSTYNSKAGCCCHVTYVPDTDWLYNNLFALAEKLSVPLSVPKKPAYRWNITEAEQLEWARQRYRMRLVEWAITRSEQRGGSSRFTNKCAYRFDAYLRFCQRNMTRIGNRHIVMLAVLSTACDNNQAASIEQARLVNATFEKPLPEKELKRICRFLIHPFKDPTIARAFGISVEELKKSRYINKRHHKGEYYDTRSFGGVSCPLASGKADRLMLALLIKAGEIPDFRISGHKAKYEAQQKSLEKKRKYDKIIPLFEEGLTIKQIADKYGVTVNTIKAQASARGFDIVKEEANRHNQKVLEMQELRNQGYSVAHIAELFGCTVSTVYRCLAKKVEATIEQLQEVGKKVEEKVEQKVEELAQTAVKTYETVRETCTSIRERAEKKIDCVAARIKAQEWLTPTKEESVAAPERVYYSLKDFLLDDDPPDVYNDIFGCYGMTAREL
jgi:predicted transcriptional regulator